MLLTCMISLPTNLFSFDSKLAFIILIFRSFIVLEIDEIRECAVASRKKAMEIKSTILNM